MIKKLLLLQKAGVFCVMVYSGLLRIGCGIGKMIMDQFQNKYHNFHQQMLTAEGEAIGFYKKCGFERAGQTEPMWIYQGDEPLRMKSQDI